VGDAAPRLQLAAAQEPAGDRLRRPRRHRRAAALLGLEGPRPARQDRPRDPRRRGHHRHAAALPAQYPNGIWSDPESGIVAIQGHIGEKDAIIKRGADVDKKLASLQGQIKAAEERLPQESEKAEMRDMIERLAREIPKDIGTVELKSVSILDSGDKGDTRTITFQTDLSGDQDGIIKYIDSIEKNTRFMAVNNLSIRSGAVTYDAGAKKIGYALHGVHMDIVTYVYNPARKAPPAAQ